MNLLGFNVDEWDSCRNEREWMGKWLIWGHHPPIREKGEERIERKSEKMRSLFFNEWNALAYKYLYKALATVTTK